MGKPFRTNTTKQTGRTVDLDGSATWKAHSWKTITEGISKSILGHATCLFC